MFAKTEQLESELAESFGGVVDCAWRPLTMPACGAGANYKFSPRTSEHKRENNASRQLEFPWQDNEDKLTAPSSCG